MYERALIGNSSHAVWKARSDILKLNIGNNSLDTSGQGEKMDYMSIYYVNIDGQNEGEEARNQKNIRSFMQFMLSVIW